MLFLFIHHHKPSSPEIRISWENQMNTMATNAMAPSRSSATMVWIMGDTRTESSECWEITEHYSEVIMGMMVSQIACLVIVYSTIYTGTDQRKHQSSMSLAFVRGIHRWPVNSPHKWPVTRKMFPFDDIIMKSKYIFIFTTINSTWQVLKDSIGHRPVRALGPINLKPWQTTDSYQLDKWRRS